MSKFKVYQISKFVISYVENYIKLALNTPTSMDFSSIVIWVHSFMTGEFK